MEMIAAHRELVNYLCDIMNDENVTNPNVLVVGKDAKQIASLLPKNYTSQTVACPSEIKSNGNAYDALLVNDVFRKLPLAKSENLVEALLRATKNGGFVQVRQYLHNSKCNLSHYSNFFESQRLNEGEGKKTVGFKIEWEQGLRCTITARHDWRDHCWMMRKMELSPRMSIDQPLSERDHLDRMHYNDQKVWKYEWIFGHGFMSPGGATENVKLLSMLSLKPTDFVLDVGSGVGGNALQISKEYGAQVLGVDLATNVVRIAYERAAQREDTRVRFLNADIYTVHLPPAMFDVAYSRDAILHMPDKHGLFERIHTWLKPGGQMLITDYMTGNKEQFSDGFNKFMQCREFTLRPLEHYVESAKKAHFVNVEGHDITIHFKELMEMEIAHAEETKDEFLQVFSEEEYEELVGGWRNKIEWIENGDLKWGMVKAVKSSG